MKGLIEEGNEAIQEEEQGVLRDLAMVAGAQKVEHYEMSGYGTVRTLAEHLGLNDAVELLQQTEDEEKEADAKLTEVAMSLYASAGEDEQAEDENGDAANEGELQTVGSSRSVRKSKDNRRR